MGQGRGNKKGKKRAVLGPPFWRDKESRQEKHPRERGGWTKEERPFWQVPSPSQPLPQQALHLQITSNLASFLVTHNRMWALGPYNSSNWKAKGFPKSVMFPVEFPAAPALGSADIMFCSSALYGKIHLQCQPWISTKQNSFKTFNATSVLTINDEILLFSASRT